MSVVTCFLSKWGRELPKKVWSSFISHTAECERWCLIREPTVAMLDVFMIAEDELEELVVTALVAIAGLELVNDDSIFCCNFAASFLNEEPFCSYMPPCDLVPVSGGLLLVLTRLIISLRSSDALDRFFTVIDCVTSGCCCWCEGW